MRRKRAVNPYPTRRVGIPCRAQPDGKQQTPSENMKMPRDGARVRRCSKKASPKRSTIRCVRHPRKSRNATSSNSESPLDSRMEQAGECAACESYESRFAELLPVFQSKELKP